MKKWWIVVCGVAAIGVLAYRPGFAGSESKEGCAASMACCETAKAEGNQCEVCSGGSAAKASAAYKIGSQVEDFSLPKANGGETAKLSDLAGENGVVLVFYNQNCPFVKEAEDRIDAFHRAYSAKGITVVAIDAGVNNSPETIAEHAQGKSFPILVNRDSKIAARFGANHTPEVFILDKDMVVRYHGAFDSGKVKEGTERTAYAENAVHALLAGGTPAEPQTKAFGCSIKYAEGVQPLT